MVLVDLQEVGAKTVAVFEWAAAAPVGSMGNASVVSARCTTLTAAALMRHLWDWLA